MLPKDDVCGQHVITNLSDKQPRKDQSENKPILGYKLFECTRPHQAQQGSTIAQSKLESAAPTPVQEGPGSLINAQSAQNEKTINLLRR